MKIENKEMLIYSAQKSVNNISKIGTTNVDEKESYYIVGTAVHWILDCIDRIPSVNVKSEHIKLFSALRCANNCLKHNVTFKEAHKAVGHGYPYDYPYDYGTHFLWSSLDEVNIPENKENQRENYKLELEGKNVYTTLSKMLEYIIEYYDEL